MKIRKLHRVIGMVMLLPLFGWAITGFIFFLKPGYEGAYELLEVKIYSIDGQIALTADTSWHEVKYLRTILGPHVIVRTMKGWQQLDPKTLSMRKYPTADEIKMLMSDAFSQNPGRYGRIVEVNGDTGFTDTGVIVTLNWDRMRFQQRGHDTELIDGLYKIHYLQWTGVKWVDMILGVAGLGLIATLSVLGCMLGLNLRVTKNS